MAELSSSKPAKYKYRQVKFSHIIIQPGESATLTANPWSFLDGFLLNKKLKTAGDNRKSYQRAGYYSKLAEDFYKAASSADMPTQSTLYYYGMMNLVKAFLAVNRVKLETIPEHHGIANTHGRSHNLTIHGTMQNCTNIFLEFAALMKTPIQQRHEVNVRHILPNIPELHAIANSTGIVKKPKMLPVNVQFLVNPQHTYLFTEISFDKANQHVIDTSKFFKGKRQQYFRPATELGGKVVHRSSSRKRLANPDWTRVYQNILREYSALGLVSVLTRSGYRYYCPMQASSLHHLCNTYLFMFYLGHTSRYRPTEITEIMDGEYRAIATEAVALCPKQFLYQLVSLITNKMCVIPYAVI